MAWDLWLGIFGFGSSALVRWLWTCSCLPLAWDWDFGLGELASEAGELGAGTMGTSRVTASHFL